MSELPWRCVGFAGALLACMACGSKEPESPDGMGGSSGEPGACNVVVTREPPSTAQHVPQCSEVTYDTNPPSGGRHYLIWPAFQNYSFVLAPGFLVHGLEHGAVVFWYNCPGGCDAEVTEVQDFILTLPADPLCAGTEADRRVIMAPSPTLEARWAASAWGFSLTADCFEAAAFADFYTDHYGNGPEDFCTAGTAFTTDPCSTLEEQPQ